MPCKRKLACLLFTCLIYLLYGSSPSLARTGYDALDDSAIPTKSPSKTPLIAVIRVDQRLIAAGQHGVIIISDDNGLTWTQVTVPVDLSLTGIYFSSARKGWAVGHYGTILQTEDGGITWKKTLTGLDVIDALNVSANEALKNSPSSPDTKLKQRVATAYQAAGPSKPFLAIGKCGGGVLAAGQQDIAMFSSDGGLSWQQWTSNIDNPHFNNIYTIIQDANSTILVGESGMVLKGDADCKNFKSLQMPYATTLLDGMLIGPGTLLLYGIDGNIFKSSDDGTTWKTFSLPVDSVVDSGAMLKSGRVLLATVGGRLFLSDEEINNFQELSISEPFQIADMVVAPNGNVIIVGNGGVSILPFQSLR